MPTQNAEPNKYTKEVLDKAFDELDELTEELKKTLPSNTSTASTDQEEAGSSNQAINIFDAIDELATAEAISPETKEDLDKLFAEVDELLVTRDLSEAYANSNDQEKIILSDINKFVDEIVATEGINDDLGLERAIKELDDLQTALSSNMTNENTNKNNISKEKFRQTRDDLAKKIGDLSTLVLSNPQNPASEPQSESQNAAPNKIKELRDKISPILVPALEGLIKLMHDGRGDKTFSLAQAQTQKQALEKKAQHEKQEADIQQRAAQQSQAQQPTQKEEIKPATPPSPQVTPPSQQATPRAGYSFTRDKKVIYGKSLEEYEKALRDLTGDTGLTVTPVTSKSNRRRVSIQFTNENKEKGRECYELVKAKLKNNKIDKSILFNDDAVKPTMEGSLAKFSLIYQTILQQQLIEQMKSYKFKRDRETSAFKSIVNKINRNDDPKINLANKIIHSLETTEPVKFNSKEMAMLSDNNSRLGKLMLKFQEQYLDHPNIPVIEKPNKSYANLFSNGTKKHNDTILENLKTFQQVIKQREFWKDHGPQKNGRNQRPEGISNFYDAYKDFNFDKISSFQREKIWEQVKKTADDLRQKPNTKRAEVTQGFYDALAHCGNGKLMDQLPEKIKQKIKPENIAKMKP